MINNSKQKQKTALAYTDLMQVLYDEVSAENQNEMANITYTVKGTTTSNSTFTTQAGGVVITTSQTAATNTHPDPVELLLAAYAASFTQLLKLVAEEQLVELPAVSITASGELDPAWLLGLSKTSRAGFQKIQLTVKCTEQVNPEELVNIIQIARDRSPVADNLLQATPVGFTLELPEIHAN